MRSRAPLFRSAALGLLLASPAAPADGLAKWPDLGAVSHAQASGAHDAVVVVGIENYLVVPRVPGAGRNATDWYAFFIDTLKVPFEHVHLVRDRSATKEGILTAVTQAATEVEGGGTLWFVFIGHGAPSKDGKEGLLVGADAQQTADGLFARSLPQSELLAVLGRPPGVHAVALIDACFSGRAGTGEAIATGLQPLVLLSKPQTTGNVVVLSAGAPDQFAGPLPDLDRPAFSYLALGALRGWGDADGDGQVTARETVGYAQKALNVLPIGRSQTPSLAGGEPTLVLTRQATEPGPRLTDLVPAQVQPLPMAQPAAPAGPDTRKLALPSESAPPGAVLVSFEPEHSNDHWMLLAAGNVPICELPCKRWVGPSSGLFVQRDADRPEDIQKLPVPESLGYSPGRSVRAVAVAKQGDAASSLGMGLGLALPGLILGVGGFMAWATDRSAPVWGLYMSAVGGALVLASVVTFIFAGMAHEASLDLTLDTRGTGVAARLDGAGLHVAAQAAGLDLRFIASPLGAFGTF